MHENKGKTPASSFIRFASFLLPYSIHKPKTLSVPQTNFVRHKVFTASWVNFASESEVI